MMSELRALLLQQAAAVYSLTLFYNHLQLRTLIVAALIYDYKSFYWDDTTCFSFKKLAEILTAWASILKATDTITAADVLTLGQQTPLMNRTQRRTAEWKVCKVASEYQQRSCELSRDVFWRSDARTGRTATTSIPATFQLARRYPINQRTPSTSRAPWSIAATLSSGECPLTSGFKGILRQLAEARRMVRRRQRLHLER